MSDKKVNTFNVFFFFTKINDIDIVHWYIANSLKQKWWICEQTHNIHVNIIKRQNTKAYTYDYIQVSGILMSSDLQRGRRQSHWWIYTISKLIWQSEPNKYMNETRKTNNIAQKRRTNQRRTQTTKSQNKKQNRRENHLFQ